MFNETTFWEILLQANFHENLGLPPPPHTDKTIMENSDAVVNVLSFFL